MFELFDNLEETKKAYFAGILDGEGYIGLAPHGENRDSKRPIVQLQMTDEKAVKAFAETFNIKYRLLTAPSRLKALKERGHKLLYHCRVECRRAYPILKALYPYMITKKEITKECLDYYDDRKCIICGNRIPHTKIKTAITCSEECKREKNRRKSKKYRKEKGGKM